MLLLGALILWYMAANTLSFSVGRCLIAENSVYMMIIDESPIKLNNSKDKEDLFDGLENGDKILVLHDGIAESYPASTAAYAVVKLSDGDISDIPETVLVELAELGWWVGVDDAELRLPEVI